MMQFDKFLTKQTPTVAPKYEIGAKIVSRSAGVAEVKNRRFSGAYWEYGLVFPGVTSNSLMWFREKEI